MYSENEGSDMTFEAKAKRKNALAVADALNKIEGVPVSEYARKLSRDWADGKITGAEMKAALLAAHKKV